eukprot:6050099-Amphidinium_carterae.2
MKIRHRIPIFVGIVFIWTPCLAERGGVSVNATVLKNASAVEQLDTHLLDIQPHETDDEAVERIMDMPYADVTGSMLNRVVKAKQEQWHVRVAAGASRAQLSKEMSAFDKWLDRVIAATRKTLAQKARDANSDIATAAERKSEQFPVNDSAAGVTTVFDAQPTHAEVPAAGQDDGELVGLLARPQEGSVADM